MFSRFFLFVKSKKIQIEEKRDIPGNLEKLAHP